MALLRQSEDDDLTQSEMAEKDGNPISPSITGTTRYTVRGLSSTMVVACALLDDGPSDKESAGL